MEIKPNVGEVRVADRLHRLCESITNALLRPFLVNQVYENLLSVVIFLFLHVNLRSFQRLIFICADADVWCPAEVGFLRPEQRNAATRLHMCPNFHSAASLEKCDDLLRFYIISSISSLI